MHKKLKIMCAAVAALFNAFAAEWFDAGISGYGQWPADGSDVVVRGEGTWSGTASAYIKGSAPAARIDFSQDGEDLLVFTPAVAKSVEQSNPVVVTSVRFSSSDVPAAFSGVDKAALTVVEEEGVAHYYGLAADPVGGTNRWARLEGATPRPGEDVELAISFAYDDGALCVRYAVDGQVLNLAGSEWIKSAPTGDGLISAVAYAGVGEIAALHATAQDAGMKTAITVPEMEGMRVASVSVGGVEVEPDESGVYVVDALSRVVVAFVPESGYVLTSRSMGFIAEGAEMAIPSEGRPQALVASETIRINEIMASNETVLNTLSGASGLDWAELRNLTSTDIDVSGWLMTDDPTKKISKWKPIEGQAIVPANGYLVVWLDSTEGRTWLLGEAHAPIGLSSGGESIALATPEGTVVSQFSFGQQLDDVSFGYGRRTKTVLSANGSAEYRVGGGSWKSVAGPVGMSAQQGMFKVTTYAMNANVSTMDDAEAYLRDSSKWKSGYPKTVDAETIAYQDSDNQSNFAPYYAFPGVSGDNFVVVVTGAVYVPRAGQWTFAVGSDDGFVCSVSRLGETFSFEYRGGRGYSVSTGTFNLPEAGVYDVKLVYFENGGGASFDFSAAEGAKEFSTGDFHLVGSAASGLIHAGALGSQVAQDVSSEMVGKSASLDWRASFDLEDGPAEGDVYRLRIRYADGFSARLNGAEFASVPASGARNAAQALDYSYFAVPNSMLRSGENTLEVTGYNNDIADTEFFLSPEIVVDKAEAELLYFKAPTPRAANDTPGWAGLTPKVEFSEPHGYKTEPFLLSLSCPDDGQASIYYTTDGTSPSSASTRYTGPIEISSTTVVRAAVPDLDSILQVDSSASYLYLSDILAAQPGDVPDGFPESGAANNQKMVYGMRRDIVDGDAETQAKLLRGFTNSIQTISLVIDPENLFSSSHGIYVNASNDGKGWERQTMVEQIDPVNGAANEFSVPAGIRIRGAFSRGSGYPKHSFRLFFRGEYGMSRLEFPLFGDEGTDSFKKIDLRTAQNHSWANDNHGDVTYIEECFSRDSQGAMGEPYNRSRYYNLFINGVYWGLYQTEERVDQNYAESYNGGKDDDYDVVRTSQPGYNTGTVEGDGAAWQELWRITTQEGYGAAHPGNYNRIRGLNADGTRNPNYPTYLNETNLMAYMICTHFVVDGDSPASYVGMANNIAAFRNRVDGDGERDGFIWNRHDAEHSLGFGWGYDDNIVPLIRGTRYQLENNLENPKSDMLVLGNFNPAELHYELTFNDEYRMKFADQVYRHCVKKGGALTATVAEARFRSRMAEIDDAIVCEAARWARDNQGYRMWLGEACGGRIDFIQKRGPNLISAYRKMGWYPSVDAPKAVDAYGTELTDGSAETVASAFLTCASAGDIYYTTDGSDPRLEGGAVNPGAKLFTGAVENSDKKVAIFARGAEWQWYDWGRQPGDDASGRTWKDEAYDSANLSGDSNAWGVGAAPLGFKNGTSFNTTLHKYEGHADSGNQVMTFYFRRKFTLPAEVDPSRAVVLSGTDWYDDGYAMYVNGIEVGRANIGAGYELSYSTGSNETGTNYVDPQERTFSFTVPEGVLHAGENTIAVELHQCHGTSSDAAFDMSLDCEYRVAVAAEGGIPVPAKGITIKARLRSAGGEWSAMEEVSLTGDAVPQASVRVAGVMSSTVDLSGNGAEFVVLTNINESAALDISGMRLTSEKTGATTHSLDLTFGEGLSIPAGGSLVLRKAEYWPASKITNGAVDMHLYDAKGGEVQTLHFHANWFGGATDGTGAHLIALDFGQTVTEETQWKPSFIPPSNENGKKAVETAIADDDRIRLWMDSLGATESGQAAISKFSGSADAVKAAYLVGMETLVDPEAELKFVDIRIEDGSVRLGGDLEVLGEYWRNRVKGSLRLYRYESLGSEPSVIDLPLTDGKFPLIDATGDSTGTFRFFRLSLE